ncbi:MAG TPA: ADYC domain-containing protein [Kofleriaceae bacterium]|nr:ADYC domain-containing protein [Kofleriaceae bacterium]
MRQVLIPLLLLVGACVDEPELGETTGAVQSLNGTSLNGTRLNGTSLNGTRLNGASLDGAQLSGVDASGSRVAAAELTGTATSPPTAGARVVGSTWVGQVTTLAVHTPLVDNTPRLLQKLVSSLGVGVRVTSPVALRIDGAEAGTGPESDLWFYTVSYDSGGGWQPLCGSDDQGPIAAVAVPGAWTTVLGDTAHYTAGAGLFTWACRGKSIAKCVEMGYRSWRGYGDQLASCVRLLRGDYCGNGTPYTVDGTLLNLYDDVGVQVDTEAWKPEAEWGPNGAVCVNKYNAARFKLVAAHDPSCVRPILSSRCGTSFSPGAFLIDELP